MIKCEDCGSNLEEDAKFCSNCGSKTTNNTSLDEQIKADIKIEVTNATTEKAFKKIGETISSSKEAVKSTTMLAKKLFFKLTIAIVSIVVLGLSLAQYYNYIDSKEAKKEFISPIKTVEKRKDFKQLNEIGFMYPLDTFTVNLNSDRRYLITTLTLELSSEEVSLELDAKTPILRDRIIRALTSKTLEEISSRKGKKDVSDQIMNTLNSIISDGYIQDVYFVKFDIQ